MKLVEMEKLQKEFGSDLKIAKHIRLHDEFDFGNKYIITYKNIIVGCELVSYDFVKENINKVSA